MFLRSSTLLFALLSLTAFGQTTLKIPNRALAQDFCLQTNISGTLQDFLCGSGTSRGKVQLGPTVAALASFPGHNIRGVSNGTAATAGHIGEVIQSGLARASAVSGVGGIAKTITSITLTAGDWDISGFVGTTGSAITSVDSSVSLTNDAAAATSTIGFANSSGEIRLITTCPSTTDHGNSIPSYKVNLSSGTTLYLVGLSGATTVNFFGFIQARRAAH